MIPLRREIFQSRIRVLVWLGCIVWSALVVKLFILQVFYASSYKDLARKQQEKRRGLIPERGKIYDRKLVCLATNLKGERLYPLGDLAGQLLGFLGRERRGLSGLEFQYDEHLKGVMGWATLLRDASGHLYPALDSPHRSPIKGTNIVLTIDADYQEIVEEELQEAVMKYGAKGGCVIIENPRNGEILALANFPSSDPNRAIAHLFEPGSTFKIVTVGGALEEEVTRPEELFFGEMGRIKIKGRTISESGGHKYGWLTLKEAVEKSSNICLIKVAQKLGPQNLYHYTRAFGFGCETGVGLPGEERGLLGRVSDWSSVKFANIAFGQGIAVTPLQLTCAYAALANGGILMRPRIIKYFLDENGKIIEDFPKETVRRVISYKSAQTLTEILEGVVEKGTGVKARVEGVRIAGKTGTAEKKRERGKGYAKGKTVASFVGYLPSDDPKLVISVIIDEPQSSQFGGDVAAPVFQKIVEKILVRPQGLFLTDKEKVEFLAGGKG